MRKEYKSDLSDKEWEPIQPHIPAAKAGGRPRKANMREILNAIFYVLKTGCQWDLLPHDFPAKGTVYHYFNTWRKEGVWEEYQSGGTGRITAGDGTRSHAKRSHYG